MTYLGWSPTDREFPRPRAYKSPYPRGFTRICRNCSACRYFPPRDRTPYDPHCETCQVLRGTLLRGMFEQSRARAAK